jgi:hypothetical protein
LFAVEAALSRLFHASLHPITAVVNRDAGIIFIALLNVIFN